MVIPKYNSGEPILELLIAGRKISYPGMQDGTTCTCEIAKDEFCIRFIELRSYDATGKAFGRRCSHLATPELLKYISFDIAQTQWGIEDDNANP